MGKIDLLSLVAGIASIASFGLAMWDRFPALKKYLQPIGYVLLGVVLGRVSFIADEATMMVIRDSQVASSLMIFFSLLLLGFLCFHFLVKRGYEILGYMILILMLSSYAPSLLSTFAKINEKIPPKDYLHLSAEYEKNNDYEGAIKYLSQYGGMVSDSQVKKQLESKIAQLRQKQSDELK